MDDESRMVSETLGWLKPVAERLSAAGGGADAVAFQSPDRNGDLTKLASEWAASDAVVADDHDASALEAIGVNVHRVG